MSALVPATTPGLLVPGLPVRWLKDPSNGGDFRSWVYTGAGFVPMLGSVHISGLPYLTDASQFAVDLTDRLCWWRAIEWLVGRIAPDAGKLLQIGYGNTSGGGSTVWAQWDGGAVEKSWQVDAASVEEALAAVVAQVA